DPLVTGVQTCALPIWREIALPAGPDDGVTLAHKKTVAGVFQSRWVVIFRSVVEKHEDALAAPVGRVVKDLAVAATQIDRLQDEDVGRILHPASGIFRRLVQIDDHLIKRASRIELSVGL